jgi:hypothetical protein
MTIVHTSPVKIEKIEKEYGTGIFEDVLFFASDAYSMSESNFVYHVEVAENEIIRARELEEYYESDAFKAAQKELVRRYEAIIDEDKAYDLICDYCEASELESDDYEELANLGWEVQKHQGQLARAFGFRFCESRDEQGTVYIGSMYNRESELVLAKDE